MYVCVCMYACIYTRDGPCIHMHEKPGGYGFSGCGRSGRAVAPKGFSIAWWMEPRGQSLA